MEVKWQGCRPSRTTHFFLLHTQANKTHENIRAHQENHGFSVLRCTKKAISLWFMVYSAQYGNISQHYLHTEPMGICCTFYCAVLFKLCTSLSIVYSFTAFCIRTFQWRKTATKPVSVEVTFAHTRLRQARASQEAMCTCVKFTHTAHTHRHTSTVKTHHFTQSSCVFLAGHTVVWLWHKVGSITPQCIKKVIITFIVSKMWVIILTTLQENTSVTNSVNKGALHCCDKSLWWNRGRFRL